MSTGTLDAQDLQSDGNTPTSTPSVSADQSIGLSNPIQYIPPTQEQPLGILDRLKRGFTKSVQSTPQMFGQGMYFLGSQFDPDASKEELQNGPSFGDKLAQMGIAMSERNQKFIQDNYPEKQDIWETVGAAAPYAGAMALGTALGFASAVAVTLTATGAAGIGLGSFAALKDQGRSTEDSDALAMTTAVGGGMAMAFGLGNFMKATGPVLKQLAKGIINGFTGGVLQSAVTGSIQLATGEKPYKGTDSLKDLMSDSVTQGVAWGLLGGGLGMHQAVAQRTQLARAYEKLGLEPKDAAKAADFTMQKGMSEGIKHVQDQVQLTKDERSRILTGRLDSLDQDFHPNKDRELSPAEQEIQSKIRDLQGINKDIASLKELLASNQDNQKFTGQTLKEYSDMVKVKEIERNQKLKEISNATVVETNQITKEHDKKDADIQSKAILLSSELSEVQRQNSILESNVSREIDLIKQEKIYKELKKGGSREDKLLRQIDSLDQQRTELGRQKEQALADIEKGVKVKSDIAEREMADDIRTGIKNLSTLLDAHIVMDQLVKEEQQLKGQINDLKQKVETPENKINQLKKRMSDIRQSERRGVQMTKDEIKDTQNRLLNMIKNSDLEANDKAKFLTTLKNIQTSEQLYDAMPEITNKIQTLEEKALQREWREELTKLNLSKLPPDHQTNLGTVLKDSNFKANADRALIDTKREKAFFLSQLDPPPVEGETSAPISEGEQMALNEAMEKPWAQLAHEQKQAVYELLKSVYQEGLDQNKMLSDLKEQTFTELKTKMLAEITDGKPLIGLKPHQEQNIEANKNVWQRIVDLHQMWRKAQVIPEYIFEGLGDTGKQIHQMLHDALQNRIDMQLRGKKLLQDTFNGLSKKEIRGLIRDKINLSDQLNDKILNYTHDDVFRGTDLLDIYAHSFNEKGLEHLKGNFTSEDIKTIQNFVETNYPKAVEGIQKRFQYYDGKGYDEMNDIHRTVSGSNMPKESFYNPQQWLAHAAGKQLEMDMNMAAKGMLSRANPNSGMTKARRGSTVPFSKFDYFGGQIRHIMDRANYIAMSKAIRDANKIFYDPDISQAIKETAGIDTLKQVRKLIRDLAFDGHQDDGIVMRMVKGLRYSFSIAKIAWSPLSAAKEINQLGPASNFVGANWVTSGLKDYMFDRGKMDTFINNRSLQMKNLGFMQEREWVEKFLQSGGNAVLTGEDNFIKLSMAMHQETYNIVSRATWLGQYYKSMAENKAMDIDDEKSAIQAADRATRLTHPMGGDLYLPDIFRGNEALKYLTVFKKAENTNANLLMQANREFGSGKGNIWSLVGKYIGVSVVPALFYAAMSLRRAPSKKEFGEEVLNQTLGSDIGMGYITQALVVGLKDLSVTTPETAPLGDLYHTFSRKDHIRYGLATFDDLRGTGFSNLYRLGNLSMFKAHPQEIDSDSSEDDYLHQGGN